MLKNVFKRTLSLLLAMATVLSLMPQVAFPARAAEGSLSMSSEGLTASYTGEGTWSGGGTAAAGTVSGGKDSCNKDEARSATLTFKNTRTQAANISFDYNITQNTGSVTIDGSTVTGSGTYAPAEALAANDTVQIVITSGAGTSKTTAIEISNISLVVDTSATTLFKAPENGSYTVNGESITADVSKTQKSTESYALVATPATGFNFLGWYSEQADGYVSYNATANIQIEADTTLYPVFVSSGTAVFQVGKKTYTDLNAANTAAQADSSKLIVLTQSGTLAAGQYTISADVKLLIPYNQANTANFSDETTTSMSRVNPTMYRCLTLADGTTIDCSGAINVNAEQFASSTQRTGSVAGPYGAIQLNAGSQLNMLSGSNLYAYGYVGGQGLVHARSGSNIYQLFQIEDWRGGSDSSSLLSSLKNNSFLFSQYYFQNVEAPLRIDAGCTMYASAALAAGLGDNKSPNQTSVAVMGKDVGMFHVTSGYAMMRYDSDRDRVVLDFYGTLVTDAISMKMNLTGLVSSSMNTKDYILGLPMNYDINIKSGSTVTFAQKFKLLPGTKVTVDQGAAASITNDGALYLYDMNDWLSGTYTYSGTLYQLPYVFSRKGGPVKRSVNTDAILQVNGSLTANGPVYSTKQVEQGGNATIGGTGTISLNAFGTTDLKEVTAGGSTNLTTIKCVPVVGSLAGHEGQKSFALGTFNALNGKWYQYTLTGSGFTIVSGAEGVNTSSGYIANAKDDPARVTISIPEAYECRFIEGMDLEGFLPLADMVQPAAEGEEAPSTVNYILENVAANVVVKAQEHTKNTEFQLKEPTCTEDGARTYSCTVCLKEDAFVEVIESEGHKPDQGTVTVVPTCTTEGTKVFKCTVEGCGAELMDLEETLPKDPNNHNEEVLSAVAPDCTNTGLTEGKVCTNEGCENPVLVQQEEIPALGHKPDQGTVAVEPTCTAAGKKVFKCTVESCQADLPDMEEILPVNPENHQIKILPSEDPDCTNTGLTEGKVCTREGCENPEIVKQEVVPALGHSSDGGVVTQAPTCTEKGIKTYTCTVCNTVITSEEIAIDPAAHKPVPIPAVAPTCTKTGLTEGTRCERCGTTLKAQEEVAKIAHTYVPTVTPPTCTNEGYTTYVCSACDDEYVSDHTEKTPHPYDAGVVTPPTCTEQGYTTYTCTAADCGHSYTDHYVAAAGHKYGQWKNTIDPTCTEQGEEKRSCSVCGDTQTQTVPATGHSFGAWIITNPTCTEDGLKVRTCTNGLCDAQESERIAATGHSYGDWQQTKASTCIEQGEELGTCHCGSTTTRTQSVNPDNHQHWDGGRYVSEADKPTCTGQGTWTYTCACGTTRTEVVDPTGHTTQHGVQKDPTCTETGMTAGSTCAVCGVVLEEKQTIDALGHNYVAVVTSPTCETQGYTTNTCSRCTDSYVDNYTDPVGDNHIYERMTVAPTCTEDGYDKLHCTLCQHDMKIDGTEVAKLGHGYSVAVKTVAPTCTEQGYTTYACERCDSQENRDYVAAAGHDYKDSVTAPTCNDEGFTTHICAVCKDTYVDTRVAPLGHSYGDWIVTTAPTCTEAGEQTKTCSRCSDVLKETVPATGHTYDAGKIIAPTCEAKGYTTYTCHCGDTKQDDVVAALGHKYGEWRVTTPATCIAKGEKQRTCTNGCGKSETAEMGLIGHAYEAYVTAPTCLDQGYTTYTCSVKGCGETYVDPGSYVTALGHSYGDWEETKAPSCVEKGEKKHTCTRCDFSETKQLDLVEHAYVAVVTAPTCLEEGYTTYTCSVKNCKDTKKENFVPALGHSYGEWEETKAPTCIAVGEKKRTCTNPGCDVFETAEVEMVPHTYEAAVTAPTCTEQGYTTYTCTTEKCAESYVDENSYVAALGHDFSVEKRVDKEPSCEEQGSRTMGCAHENCKETREEVILALGHDYHDSVTPGTCTSDGNLHTECSRCHDASDTPIPAKGHTAQLLESIAPTCTESGLSEGYKCSECGVTYQPQEEIPALGHDYDEGTVNQESTCLVQGNMTLHCNVCGHEKMEKLPLADHTYAIDEAVAPTCLEPGLTQGRHCTLEGCTYVEAQEEVPATGHTVISADRVEPSCTVTGREEGTRCSVCNEILSGDEIPLLPHDAGSNPWIIIKTASCSEVGTETSQCAACNAPMSREIEKLPHTPETIPGVAPRYDAVGYTEGSKCINCEEILEEPQEIPKLVLTWETFLMSMHQLETYAIEYAANNPGKDATKLVINFIRTGIERYNDSEWETMAGAPETVFINEVLAKDEINGTYAYALREIDKLSITLPNGQNMVFDHLFGALNVSSHKNYTQSNTDFGSWVGDLCDLMQYANKKGFVESEDMEAMVAEIREKYFREDDAVESGFGMDDVRADLDAFYVVQQILAGETSLRSCFEKYYTAGLTDRSRAAYFLNNRFPGQLTQEEVRASVYTTYKDHLLAQLLESGRGLSDKHGLREASCYTFADYLFALAKDDLVAPEQPDEEDKDDSSNPDVYSVFSSAVSTLAPGITQNVSYAIDSKGDQMVFYMAVADINRADVSIYANYNNNDPTSWAMSPVSAQMKAAQDKHTNPEDPENYIPNYTSIVGTNANFYNMSTGEPSGLFAMNGVIYTTGRNFFAILKDGTPVIAEASEFAAYRDRIQEAVSGGQILLKDGVNVRSPEETGKMPRSTVGITESGKIVLLVVDGRQAPFSAGATYYEVAQILLDAGCVDALELDGGGSATFAAKQEGNDHISLVNRPCDTFERSVANSLLVVSTAVMSKEFDHAVLSTATDYLTVGSRVEVGIVGVSAAGNPADVPADAYLAVADESIGRIEDGSFVGLARGETQIQLISGGKVVGTKTVTVLRRPDALKFTETSLNAIYGIAEPLPLVATYQNANVTINADDIVWELSNEIAGKVENFAFTGNEASGVRNVVVTAKVKTDANITANISLRLYSANESIFDFDNVTAGSESLAWNRELTNATTADGKNYYAEDPNGEIVANYTFALDMKAIKAPARLQPLMEYLNGFAGNVGADASPWDYLLALGARVSSLTNVVIRAQFPAGVDVDYGNLNFVNDFMTLKTATFDESKRILTIELNWIRQTDGIDPSTANSIGILSGLKVIQKDSTVNVTTMDVTGNVTYDIYMDTSQLYSFAQDPANQKKYGIMPYVNPDDSEDAGGHFMDTYITFEDHFTVNRGKLNGWVSLGEGDLHYYYVDNERVTGIYYADDMEGSDKKFFYNFGDDGVCVGKVTGVIRLGDDMYYAIGGEKKTGWWTLPTASGEPGYHYFDSETGVAADGKCVINGYNYTFEDHVLVRGEIVTTSDGKMHYRWADTWAMRQWVEDGDKKYFATYDAVGLGYFASGLASARKYGEPSGYAYYLFGEDCVWQENYNGLYHNPANGKIYLIENGRQVDHAGLVKIGDDFYYFSDTNYAVQDKEAWVSKTNGLMPEGLYPFGPDGKLKLPEPEKMNGIVEEEGKLWYYVDGVRTYAGLIKIDNDYYYVRSGGQLVQNRSYWVTRTNGLLPEANYTFGADGKMLNAPVIPTEPKPTEPEVTEPKPTEPEVTEPKPTEPEVTEPKPTEPEVTEPKPTEPEVTEPKPTEPEVTEPKPTEPPVKNGIVEEDGNLWYYVDGVRKYMGLIELDGDYYYVKSNGQLVQNRRYWVTRTNGLLPEASYTFDAYGRMMEAPGYDADRPPYGSETKPTEPEVTEPKPTEPEVTEPKPTEPEVTEPKPTEPEVTEPKPTEPEVTEPKPTEPEVTEPKPTEPPVKNGIVEEDGNLWYYVDGVRKYMGLIELDGDYYYVKSNGQLVQNRRYWVTRTNGLLPEASYTFDAYGRMIEAPGYDADRPPYGSETKPTEPEVTEPKPTEPEVTEPKPTEPEVTEPKPTEPEVTEPKPTEPEATESKPTEPEATEPKPTEPPVKNGIVEEDGNLWYYVDGVRKYMGLIELDGDYYYVKSNGQLVQNRRYWVTRTNGLLPEASYNFNAEGKLVF